MKNSINEQFKMKPGSKEVYTPGTFKIDKAMTGLNMGHLDDSGMNYGMADSPAPKTDPDKNKVGSDGMTDYARKRKAKQEAARKKIAELKKKREEAKKKRESGEYKGPSGRRGDFSFGPIRGNTRRYGEGG
tara:strand:+ start:57 stop:449 length:393 start_codon:yes stop_codon:yes gene_type:complete